jgi:hypothetical protein
MKFGLWVGLVAAGVLTVILQWHLDRGIDAREVGPVGRTLLGDIASAAGSLQPRRRPVPFTSRAADLRAGPSAGPAAPTGQMRAMSSTGTLFAIVDRTSNATALVDWKLWRKAKSGRKEDRAEVTSHAALDLWNRPNKFMPRQEFVESFHPALRPHRRGRMGHRPRDPASSLPLEMWPVRPDRMTPSPTGTRS